DENLQPLGTDRKNAIKALSARYRAAIAAIQAGRVICRQTATTVQQRVATLRDIARNIERGNYFLDELGDQVRDLRLSTHVDPRRGVLASAAMPVFADPIVIGAERYVDAGIREIIPMEIAVRNGVTDIVGICCSSLELPRVDDMSNAGLAEVGMRELTQIALQEVTVDDIAAARAKNISCTVIAPTFDVHGGTEVNESLIEISSAYGWMRAGDEMQPALDSARRDFRRLSDLIATFRIRSYSLERYIGENDWFVRAVETREPVATVRTYRWIIRELLARRTELGLPLHPQAQRWWRNWAHEFRPLGPFGTVSVWSRLSAFSNNGTEAWVADGVLDPNTYAPDAGSLIDAGTDQVYWMVRGAVFLASNETEHSTTRTPTLAVPHATFTDLPRIPRGSHLMAEQNTPTQVWIVRNGTRYRSTPALVTASGMAGQPVARVPPGGLAQIPDGGLPYWLGGLYVSDNLRHPVDRWEPTPQVEGSTSSTAVGLTNKTAQPVVVSGLTITTSQDGGGTTAFSVTTPLPLTVPPNSFLWVNAQFRPRQPGPITGTVSVTCNDPAVGQFAVPLATSATPLGPHGVLQVSPSSLDFGVVRAGRPAGQSVTLTNVGARSLGIAELRIIDSSPDGQFAIPLSFPGQLTPGQSQPVYLSCTPTTRGPLTATLSAHVSSATDTPYPFEQRVDVPLAATAQAPVVLLAGRALPPAGPPLGPPLHPGPGFPLPHPGGAQLLPELTLLDFGSAAPGTTVTRTFWIRNVGDAPLSVSSVDTTGPAAFGVPNLSIFPAVVNPGGELAVQASFGASAVAGAPAAATLVIHSDDPLRPRAELAVAGRTVGGHLTMQPAELLTLNSGAPPTGELVINSDGTDPVTLQKIGVDDHDFALSGVPAPGTTLGPGASLTIDVTYTGMTPGRHDGSLDIAHDATASQSRIFLRAFT
ncbi:MAG TPA: choice-of-anchor D domain-containing protein, partial [Nocardioidaceae bacterium]